MYLLVAFYDAILKYIALNSSRGGGGGGGGHGGRVVTLSPPTSEAGV